jgi:hypothetical protein
MRPDAFRPKGNHGYKKNGAGNAIFPGCTA